MDHRTKLCCRPMGWVQQLRLSIRACSRWVWLCRRLVICIFRRLVMVLHRTALVSCRSSLPQICLVLRPVRASQGCMVLRPLWALRVYLGWCPVRALRL